MPPTPKPRTLAAGLALLAALLASCGDDDTTAVPEKPTETTANAVSIEGVVQIRPAAGIIGAGGLFKVGSSCDGTSGGKPGDNYTLPYFGDAAADLTAGAQVVISETEGATVGIGELDEGEWVALPTGTNLSDHVCEMPFVVEDLPAADFYEVEVADEAVTIQNDDSSAVEIVIEAPT